MKYEVKSAEAGGYDYLPGEFQYSSGVAARSGYELVRVRFSRIVPIAEGFERIKAHLERMNRPLLSFAGCELRSPEPFSPGGFKSFNEIYVQTLRDWKICDGDDNPVARSNLCPLVDPPSEPGFYAFSYTVPTAPDNGGRTFVITGQAETIATEDDPYFVVEAGNTTEDGMRKKGLIAIAEMEKRMAAFGYSWADTTAINIYTIQSFHELMSKEMAPRGMTRAGLTWNVVRPPVVGIDYEMDCRCIERELVLPVT